MKSVEQRSDDLDKEMAKFLTGYTRRKVVDFFFLVIIILIIIFATVIIHKEDLILKALGVE